MLVGLLVAYCHGCRVLALDDIDIFSYIYCTVLIVSTLSWFFNYLFYCMVYFPMYLSLFATLVAMNESGSPISLLDIFDMLFILYVCTVVYVVLKSKHQRRIFSH